MKLVADAVGYMEPVQEAESVDGGGTYACRWRGVLQGSTPVSVCYRPAREGSNYVAIVQSGHDQGVNKCLYELIDQWPWNSSNLAKKHVAHVILGLSVCLSVLLFGGTLSLTQSINQSVCLIWRWLAILDYYTLPYFFH